MNKLQTLLSAKLLVLLPFILLLFYCEKKVDNNKNILTSLVLTLSGDESFDVSIDDKTKTGMVKVSYETDLSKLKVKSMKFSSLATCSVKVGDIVTFLDNSFKVTVTAQNGDKAVYTIYPTNIINNDLISLALSISDTYSLVVSLDGKTKTGKVNVPYETDDELKKLKVKNISFSSLATCSIKVGDSIPLDSNKSFNITVTAQNGEKTTYNIEVVNNSNALTSLVLTLSSNDSFDVSLDNKTKTGTITIPYETTADLNKLKVKSLKFSSSATCSVKVDNGITLDSNSSFKITVTAQNGDEVIYTIYVNAINKSSINEFSSFRFLQSADSRLKEDATFNIDATNVSGTVTYLESNVLKPVFTVSPGATVKVNGKLQTSGVSEQDFTSPVTYEVVSRDGKQSKTYTVSVNFYYDKLNVTPAGVLGRKDPTNLLTGKLILADKMNGYIIKSIDKIAFKDCVGLTGSLILPNAITSIGNSAFQNCKGFDGILVLPNSIKIIESTAFTSCEGFTGNLKFPNGITSIGIGAFQNCAGFTGDLTLHNSITVLGDAAFYNCAGFNGNLTLPNTITSIETGTFSGCTGFKGNLTFPNTITNIEIAAFQNCSGFDGTLTLSDGITRIETSAFRSCSGFKGDLTLPNGITRIDMFAFYGCSGFDGTLTIPASVTKIDLSVFRNCTGFTKLCNKSTATPGAKAFEGVTTNTVGCP